VTDTTTAGLGLASLAAVVEALPDGVAVLDADETICYVNPAGARLLQRPADELVRRPVRVALPELGDATVGFLRRARRTGMPVTWRCRYAPTGAWLCATAVPAGDLVQVTFGQVGDRLTGRTPAAARNPGSGPVPAGDADGDADRARLRFLADVTEAMTESLDVGEAATQLAELVVPRLCDWAIAVVTGDDGHPGEEGRAHRDPARRADVDTYRDGRMRATNPDNPMGTALLTGEPVQLVPLDEARIAPTLPTEQVRAAWRRLDTTSATIVPLRARGEIFGALAMMMCGARPPHTATQIATAVEVTRRASVSLDNARLYGRQLKIAETLQHSLLTPPTQTDPDHVQIAVRYRPAASHQAVGGDWYDSFQQPDGDTVLVIGDVAGHSVEAAASMSAMRSMLRALGHDRPGSPARTLTRLDRVLTGLHVESLATALVARVEQPAAQAARGLRTLRWSSAGHPPPLLLHADGRVQVLDTRPERLLGTDWTGQRSDHEAVLHPGDTLLLVTDGMIEHGRRHIDEGMSRLAAELGTLADLPVEELCDQLLDRIVAGQPDDDVALLALRCHPQPAQHDGRSGTRRPGWSAAPRAAR
jgi:sigma-B regulation protein RsbU (phosphoserine phosphatase)